MSFGGVIAGLDPAIHFFCKVLDHRVSRFARPGDDSLRGLQR